MVINCRSVSGSEGGAAAGCSTPCGCVMADDGIKVIGDSYVVNTGEGRRNTVVSGTGTVSNPYTVSFIDSEFFRPEAGEFSFPNQDVTNNAYDLLDFSNGPGVVAYQTPHTIFLRLEGGGLGDFTVKGFFQFVGASVEFANSTVGARKIVISYVDGANVRTFAGNTSEAPGESLTLSTVGFFPGRFSPSITHPVGFSEFKVHVWQDSGGNMSITNLKFWVGSL